VSPHNRDAFDVDNLGLPDTYPRDLIALVTLRLPLTFVAIAALTTRVMRDWLNRRRIPYISEGPLCRLHGALVARAGFGIVFVDSTDDRAEQQFTAAHETAHFIEDHVRPRQKALDTFGELIRPVLDGHRAPTREESVSAVLNRVPLGVQVHLMARSRAGAIYSWDVEEREQRADRLALELLAPANAAMKVLRQSAGSPGSPESDAAAILSKQFDLPLSAARPYVRLLRGRGRPRQKLSERLLGGNR
jgi:hypothetical protein